MFKKIKGLKFERSKKDRYALSVIIRGWNWRTLSALIPNVTLVVFNAVRLQESAVLVLKSHSLVMLFLVFYISNHLVQIGLPTEKAP